MTIDIDDFLKLRATLPVADVRSELEFGQGHMHGAVNIPLLNTEERAAVGIDYKNKGQAEAIRTGFRLVGPRFLQIVDEAQRLANGKELLVHCWRGGMRSSNFCQIIGMAKIPTHQLQGGYKAYREKALASYRTPMQLHVIGGCTGAGKSEVLRTLADSGEQVLDLETLASHKGSVFGGLMMPPQPTTEQFQNDLFEAILKLDLSRRIWVEDESIAIGRIFLPQDFWNQMNMAPVYQLELDKSNRVERLVNEYGPSQKDGFLEAMAKIVKKLGGQHYKAARQKVLEGDMYGAIEILLNYYDKAYETGLKNKRERIRDRIRWDGRDPVAAAENLVRASVSARRSPAG